MSPKKAKEHCGYQPKPVLPTCGNCASFKSDLVPPAWALRDIAMDGEVRFFGLGEFKCVDDIPASCRIEANLRCSDHGFATKKMASCKLFRPVATQAKEQ